MDTTFENQTEIHIVVYVPLQKLFSCLNTMFSNTLHIILSTSMGL